MTCYHPLTIYPNPNGGRPFFSKPEGHSGRTQQINCGQCIGCIIDHSSMWATRMMLEASLWPHNEFVTLTYSDEKLPANNELKKEDMQLFIKRLRKAEGENKIRFLYSGEYGDSTSRPHYHAIIYNLFLPDREEYKPNKRGDMLYKSAYLSDIWQNGQVTTGDVTQQSCGYVASYVIKDLRTGRWKDDQPVIDTETGESRDRVKPFICMSRRPGIAGHWYKKFKNDVFPDDFLVTPKGKKVPTPTYFRKLLEKDDPALAEQLKQKRITAVKTPQARRERKPERLKVREFCRKEKITRARADAEISSAFKKSRATFPTQPRVASKTKLREMERDGLLRSLTRGNQK